MAFVGRKRELDLLAGYLDRIQSGGADDKGRALLLRGRRRVGKSRLIQVFCQRARVPAVFFSATLGADSADEKRAFAHTVATESTLDSRELFVDLTAPTWESLLRQFAAALPDDKPSIVVIDEIPYLIAGDPSMEGALQTVWDRYLSRKPVLLILIGSDLAMMEKFNDYQRPFHQRANEMVLGAFSPYEVSRMLHLNPAEAFDAYLITGGLPLICQAWKAGEPVKGFLARSFADPTSALIVSGERTLAAEFPAQLQARQLLSIIGGSGERSFSNIAQAAGTENQAMSPASLSKSLHKLAEKRLITVDIPVSTKDGSANKRYRIADPHLRFWLTFVEKSVAVVERGQPQLAMQRWRNGWSSWRGRAIEPVIRQSLVRLVPNQRWPEVEEIGGWWPRTNNPEIDLVGADRAPIARRIGFVGSIKWHEKEPFGQREFGALARNAHAVPGAHDDVPLVAVSRQGIQCDGLASALTAKDLLHAWQ